MERFISECLTTKVDLNPWPHQIIQDTFSIETFTKLRKQCEEKLNFETKELLHIFPNDFKKWGIDFYDETLDICKKLLQNAEILCGRYPKYRWYPNLGVNAHISITPPLPYKFYIHQEGIEKIWSSVTYITPENNVGTKMYSTQNENALVKEAKWNPNSTFIFCGQENKTWHSYESNQNTNRITFNLFIMKWRKKCFYPAQ
jgi:hypothetical protein|tara:strand:- start:1725 stop:2327 length:603 start_codon:yes stop_codon:yes gene_type:complete